MRKLTYLTAVLTLVFIGFSVSKLEAHTPKANGKWIIMGSEVVGCGDSGNFCYYNVPSQDSP